MSTATTLLDAACDSGIACLSARDLRVVLAQALATTLGMTANQLLTAACASGVSCLSAKDLEVVIAEGIVEGGAGGGGGGSNQIKTYVSDPNTELVVPGDQTKGALAYPTVANAGPLFNWNTVTHIWE